MAASWWIFVMLPVLWATGVPGGRPAGIASLKRCRFRISIICRLASASTASSRAIRSISTISARAVVELFRPLAKALLSSTPRRTIIPPAPIPSTVRWTFGAPSRWISRLVAKFELTVIIGSHSSRSVIVCPIRL